MSGYLTTNENGEFTGTVTGLTTGQKVITATFEGDDEYNRSTTNKHITILDPTIELSLTTPTEVIQIGDTATITVTLTRNSLPFVNQEIIYEIKNGSSIIDRSSDFTNNAGQITISYTGTGIGDIEVKAIYNSLEETVAIEDCWTYDTNKYTSSTTLNIDLPTSAFKISYYMHRTNGTNNSQGYSYITLINNNYDLLFGATGSIQGSTFLGRVTGSSTWSIQYGTTVFPNDTEIFVEYVFDNNTHTVTLYNANDNTVISTATFTNSNYNPTKLTVVDVGSYNKAEKIKIKKI